MRISLTDDYSLSLDAARYMYKTKYTGSMATEMKDLLKEFHDSGMLEDIKTIKELYDVEVLDFSNTDHYVVPGCITHFDNLKTVIFPNGYVWNAPIIIFSTKNILLGLAATACLYKLL